MSEWRGAPKADAERHLEFMERADPQLVQDARQSMIQRLADDINLVAHAQKIRWTCCWQDFDHGRNTWTWQFCNGGAPGHLTEPCGHWHHRHEVFLAFG